MAEEKAKATRIKKKKWIQILSPALLKNELIGEIPIEEPGSLIGRIISVNLMSLTRDIKKQNSKIKFSIDNIKGDKAITEFYGYYLNPNSIKRLVRRGKEKIGISIICKTSDNKRIRIMALMIPYSKVKSSAASAFRNNATSYLASYAAKTTFENMIKEVVGGRLQRELKDVLRKVYPIRILEIAKLHIQREKKPLEKEIKVEEKPKEKVEEETPKKPSKETEKGLEKSETFQKEEKPKEEKKQEGKKEEPKEEKEAEEKPKETEKEAPKEEPKK